MGRRVGVRPSAPAPQLAHLDESTEAIRVFDTELPRNVAVAFIPSRGEYPGVVSPGQQDVRHLGRIANIAERHIHPVFVLVFHREVMQRQGDIAGVPEDEPPRVLVLHQGDGMLDLLKRVFITEELTVDVGGETDEGHVDAGGDDTVTGAMRDVTMEESASNHRSAFSGRQFDRGEGIAVEVTHIHRRHIDVSDDEVVLSFAREGASILATQRGRTPRGRGC